MQKKKIRLSQQQHIRKKNKVNQWKNTSSVIEWHHNIKRKDCSFAVFDIESFYPSISTKLL